MIYTKNTKKAINLCYEAHKNQMDKSGVPYVFHPYHLAEQMPDEETTIVALLHDVVEDTDYTIEDLREMGFSETVLEAIEFMTHDRSVPYMEYIEHIKKNRIATIVKKADLEHNGDLSRFDEVTDRALAIVEKYKVALKVLQNETKA